MAAIQQFVTCVPGQWTQVCQYLDGRRALIVQVMSGDAVFAINTSGPIVTTPYGALPCGIFSSLSDGTGPARFEITQIDHGDLVIQDWYVWVVGSATPVTPAVAKIGDNTVFPSVGPQTLTITYTQAPGVLVAIVMQVTSSATANSLTSALLGVLTPVGTEQTVGSDGDFGTATMYRWMHPGGTDTLTQTVPQVGVCRGAVFVPAAAGNLDASGGASGNDVVVAIQTAGNTTVDDYAFVVLVNEGLVSEPFDPGGTWNDLGVGFFRASIALQQWQAQAWWQDDAVTGTPVLVTNTFADSHFYAGVAAAVIVGSAATPTTVAVFQSFDLPEPLPAGQGSMMKTGLPKLSPGGVAALVDLQKRLGTQPEVSDAAADTTGDV